MEVCEKCCHRIIDLSDMTWRDTQCRGDCVCVCVEVTVCVWR